MPHPVRRHLLLGLAVLGSASSIPGGRRENYDGATGEAHRLPFGTYFDF